MALRETIRGAEDLQIIRGEFKSAAAVPLFKLRETVTIKGYVFRVMVINPGLVSLKPIGPVKLKRW